MTSIINVEALLALLAGTLYGLVIGIIPAAGATTGLVASFAFVPYFIGAPYAAVIFFMAVVAASTTGDSYSGVLLGIPGADSAAATMVDGFPLALQGRATFALTAAVITSTFNALLWGAVTFFLMPLYSQLLVVIGIPELWAFVVLALATVTFLTTRRWIRSILALCLGLYLGLVGVDPTTNVDRFTLGWGYLADGIQMLPMVAGLFAIPELIAGLRVRHVTAPPPEGGHYKQTWEGIAVVWQHRWTAVRGGIIGAVVGVMPGLGGGVADWLAYGATIAANPKEQFGKGNIKGIIGCEGANNAQKATSMIPTVLFGIPGAPFAAIILALLSYLNFEVGTAQLAQDSRFFAALAFGFLAATILVAVICLAATPAIAALTRIRYVYYFPVVVILIVWACVQYTGRWEDHAILALCSALGFACKLLRFSRPALLLGFILSHRVEAYTVQLTSLYSWQELMVRPTFVFMMLCFVAILVGGLLRKSTFAYE